MNCKWCGKVVGETDKFCQNCGGNLTQSNVQNVGENVQVVNSTIKQDNNFDEQSNNQEKVNIWLVILSVFIPIAGLIIFLVKKDEDKKTAKASGIAALISFGVSIILLIISIVIVTIGVNRVVTNTFDKVKDQIEEQQTNIKDIMDDNLENEQIDDVINDNISTNNWKDYSVSINNNVIKLPVGFNDLSSVVDFKMKSSEEKSYISPNYYTLVNLYKNEKLALYIELLNDKTEDILYTDAQVTRISQTEYQISNGADIVIFPGNLKAGQEITKDEIINLFGTPSDISNYESNGYTSDTYSYFEDTLYTTTNYYKIKVVNGKIDELTLDHRNYK